MFNFVLFFSSQFPITDDLKYGMRPFIHIWRHTFFGDFWPPLPHCHLLDLEQFVKKLKTLFTPSIWDTLYIHEVLETIYNKYSNPLIGLWRLIRDHHESKELFDLLSHHAHRILYYNTYTLHVIHTKPKHNFRITDPNITKSL